MTNESARAWLEELRPAGEEGKPMPEFMQLLGAGDLVRGESFWR